MTEQPTTPAPAVSELPLWAVVATHEDDGTPVHAACVVAEAARVANAAWGQQAANTPECADQDAGVWLVPLCGDAAGALVWDARVRTPGGVIVLDVQ